MELAEILLCHFDSVSTYDLERSAFLHQPQAFEQTADATHDHLVEAADHVKTAETSRKSEKHQSW